MHAARDLFVEHGYAAVSADAIVAAAGVTRGALYHHFKDKRDLFRAVFVDLERRFSEELEGVLDTTSDPVSAMINGLATFLDMCERPEVLRLGLTDAPAVLGWEEWRSIEERHGLGLLERVLERAAADGLLVPVPIGVLAHLVLSACIEAALFVAHSNDRAAARAGAEQGLTALLSGLLATPANDRKG